MHVENSIMTNIWRGNENGLLAAIILGFDCDPSPCTAEEFAEAFNIDGDNIVPVYKIARNLWMLAHTGYLIMEKKNGMAYFRPSETWDLIVKRMNI